MGIAGQMGKERAGFPSPFEVAIPPVCDGWEEMYAHHVLFGEDRRAFEETRFWFQDGLHAAEPLYPFDSFLFEYAVVALDQANSRLFAVPQSLGVECRILNGYVYASTNLVTDDAALAERAELFSRRSGHYYEHWDELYERWLDKVEAATSELIALEVPEMGEFEDESIVTEGRGLGSSYALLQAYDRLIEGVDRIFQYHFEFLSLGYGAYFVFYEQCRQAFPEITDQTLAQMVSAIDVLVLRPDDELRRLARLAVELGVSEVVASGRERGRARHSSRGQRCRRTVAGRLRGDEGPVVLLLLRNGCLSSPPSLLDRRHQVSDRDDRLVHRATRGWRGHLTTSGGSARRAGARHPGVPGAAPARDAQRIRRKPRARPHGLPLCREPPLLHRPPLHDDLLEQGARVRGTPDAPRVPGERGGRLPAPP